MKINLLLFIPSSAGGYSFIVRPEDLNKERVIRKHSDIDFHIGAK